MHVDGLIAYGSTAYDSVRRLDAERAWHRLGDHERFRQRQPVVRRAHQRARSSAWPMAVWTEGGRLFHGRRRGPFERTRGRRAGFLIGNQSAQSTRLTAGAYLSVALPVPFGVRTNVNADYVHDNVRSAVVDGQLRSDPSTRLNLIPDASLDPLDPGYFVWSVGAKAQIAKVLSGFVTYRTLATAASVTSNELTWGMRFETKLH